MMLMVPGTPGTPEPGSPNKKYEQELLSGLAKTLKPKQFQAFEQKYKALKDTRKPGNGTLSLSLISCRGREYVQ
jgi:hypothetical protein